MKTTIEQRLSVLQTELDTGKKMLTDLDAKRADLTTTLLRIEGAIQVLRELLESDSPSARGQDSMSPEAPES